jgi:hypothetical protein
MYRHSAEPEQQYRSSGPPEEHYRQQYNQPPAEQYPPGHAAYRPAEKHYGEPQGSYRQYDPSRAPPGYEEEEEEHDPEVRPATAAATANKAFVAAAAAAAVVAAAGSFPFFKPRPSINSARITARTG